MGDSGLLRRGWAWTLGTGEFALLGLLGRLEDKIAAVYRLDAALSAKRLRSRLIRQESADRADPASLRWSERSVYSQNGEDGVIEEVFRRIGTNSKVFVEVGAADGSENCTRNLLEDGWSGVWIEADAERVARAAKISPRVRVIAKTAERDTLTDLLRAEMAINPDLVVIDIDGDDLGILRSTLAALRPRAFVVEYNAVFGHRASWSMRPGGTGSWDGTFRHGASLGAIKHVATVFGYKVVHCDGRGVNAFFVRSDFASGFSAAGCIRRIWRVGAFSAHPFGHPRSRRALAAMSAIDPDDLRAVTIERVRQLRPHRSAAGIVEVAVTLRNGSSVELTSGEPNAFHLSLRWLGRESELRDGLPRWPLPHPVAPGATAVVRLWLPRRSAPGPHCLRVTALCEFVFWREDLGGAGAFVDLEVQ